MNERDAETIKLIATVLGNIAAIALGVAMFEGKQMAIGGTILSGAMSYMTIRSLR